MKIAFKCPNCDKGFTVAIDLGGRMSKCGCGYQFRIPEATAASSVNSPNDTDDQLSDDALLNTFDTDDSHDFLSSFDSDTDFSTQTAMPSYGQPQSSDSKLANHKGVIVASGLVVLLAAGTLAAVFLSSRNDPDHSSGGAGKRSVARQSEPSTNADAKEQALSAPETSQATPAQDAFNSGKQAATQELSTDFNSIASPSETPSTASTDGPPKPIANASSLSPNLSNREESGKFVFGTMALLREGKFEEVLPRAQVLIEADFVVGFELQALAIDGLAGQTDGSDQRKHARKAIDAFTVLMEKHSDSKKFLYQRGVNYGRLEEWEKSIDDLGVAVNHPNVTNEQIIKILVMRAYAFEQLGDSEQATRHHKVIEGMKTGKLKDHASLFLNRDRRYVAEFNNADFVFSLQEDGTYLLFPLGLTMDIKVDARGNVTGSVARGTFEVRGNNIKLSPNDDHVIEGKFINDDIKIVAANYDFGKRLVGRTFEYVTPEEFVRHSDAHKGGNGHHIKEAHEMFHRFILALDGGDMDVIFEFTYLGLGPKETAATLKAVGDNPKIRRVWLPGGKKVEPNRALQMLQELDKAKGTLKESGFDTSTLKFFVLSVPEKGDLVANIGDKNGLIFTVYFNDIYWTPMGLKLFGPPRLRRKK